MFSQTIDLNKSHIENYLRYNILKGKIESKYTFTQRPININFINFLNKDESLLNNYSKTILSNKKKSFKIDLLPIDYILDYNSQFPYNRNNGSMIPNRGYQHIISTGFFFKIGPLSIKFNPEHHYSENLDFDGFWEGHQSVIWASRYNLWNTADLPEKFGNKRHNRLLTGQSSIRLNWKGISLGLSSENIWWGPSVRNSIMMSNHSEGFKHISFNSTKPLETVVGNFEWQLISARLEPSKFLPPNIEKEHAGTKLYVPKINQNGVENDWRYMQALNLSFSPSIFKNNLTIGYIRWVQMYSYLLKGNYWWIDSRPSYFPIFNNLFRKNDSNSDIEKQTDQAAGLYIKVKSPKIKAEFYAEYHYNDAKQNLRDLLLDTEHSRAITVGFQKLFEFKLSDLMINWEWTQMEQSASRLVRNSGSWYAHAWVYHGYTNKGEVIGSGIGPGSNSNYIKVQRIKKNEILGVGFEVIDNDNDFYYEAFASSGDYRRQWKDFNLHLTFEKKLNKIWLSTSFILNRSLNYQWELDDNIQPYYHAGNDKNNFHSTIKVSYFFGK